MLDLESARMRVTLVRISSESPDTKWTRLALEVQAETLETAKRIATRECIVLGDEVYPDGGVLWLEAQIENTRAALKKLEGQR